MVKRKPKLKDVSYPESSAVMWSNVIGSADKGDYSLWLLANQLSDFTIDLFAQRERISKEQAREQLLDGTINLPPNIKSFLIAGTEVPSFRHYTDLITRSNNSRMTAFLKIDLYEFVEFLESNFQ
jgi:hypothetical protein